MVRVLRSAGHGLLAAVVLLVSVYLIGMFLKAPETFYDALNPLAVKTYLLLLPLTPGAFLLWMSDHLSLRHRSRKQKGPLDATRSSAQPLASNMKRMMSFAAAALMALVIATATFAQQATCKLQSIAKKIAAKALTDFMQKCENDAEATCENQATVPQIGRARPESLHQGVH